MALLVEFGYALLVLYKNDANRKSLAATDEVYDESYADCQVKRRRYWLPNVVTVHFKTGWTRPIEDRHAAYSNRSGRNQLFRFGPPVEGLRAGTVRTLSMNRWFDEALHGARRLSHAGPKATSA